MTKQTTATTTQKESNRKTGKTNLRFNSKSHSIPKFALELDIQLEVSSFHKRCNPSVHADKSGKEIQNNDEKNAKANENGNKSGWATLDSEVRGYAKLCNC